MCVFVRSHGTPSDTNGSPVATVEMYNWTTGVLTVSQSLSVARSGPCGVALNGVFIFAGGLAYVIYAVMSTRVILCVCAVLRLLTLFLCSASGATAQIDWYSINSDSWNSTLQLATPLQQVACAALTGSNFIVFSGGLYALRQCLCVCMFVCVCACLCACVSMCVHVCGTRSRIRRPRIQTDHYTSRTQ